MKTCSVADCTVKHYGRGLCKRHYHRAWAAGSLDDHARSLVSPGATLDERLRHTGWTVIDSGCWVWSGGLNTHGYGQLADGSGRPAIASRAAYEAWVSPIPPGMAVCHTCDNPPCINPKHLFLGTKAANNADMAHKRRSSNGERRSTHKLTDVQVGEIRERYAAGGVLQRELAAEYGVSQQLVGLIAQGRRRGRPTNPPLAARG